MWSVVEVNVSICCGCVPGLKPLVARFAPKLLRDAASGGYSRHTLDDMLPSSRTQPPLTGPNSREEANGNSFPGFNPEREEREGSVEMLDILNRPEASPPKSGDTETGTHTSSSNRTMTFFDFVNMKKPANMLKLSNRESISPLALTTILFFLWGFSYGLLDILNRQFQHIIHASETRSLGLHAAYFGGYTVGPCIAWFTLKKWGFRGTFISGLCIYACGSLIFWPSAVLTSFAAFTVSNVVVGVGLAMLETSGNPFIALCGPQENSEIRLNISQGVQAIGSVVSPLLAQKVLFKDVNSISALVDVQWTYLAIALFDVLLAVAFYYLSVPEASDQDLQELADRRGKGNSNKFLGMPVVWVTLALGTFSLFFYVGAQEVLSTSFIYFVQASHAR